MRRLAIFARRPIPGEVKTRLSPAMPAGLAAELHEAMLVDALAAAYSASPDELVLYWASAGPEPSGLDLPPGVRVAEQCAGELGERLASAFAELLRGATHRAVVIGTDCPDLGPDTIRDAFAALETHDLVLGPARDGGYYLIGLRRQVPALFEGVSWGTERVLAQTLTRAEQMGFSVSRLATLPDLDTPADLVEFVARRGHAPDVRGRRTEAALRAMGLLPPVPAAPFA